MLSRAHSERIGEGFTHLYTWASWFRRQISFFYKLIFGLHVFNLTRVILYTIYIYIHFVEGIGVGEKNKIQRRVLCFTITESTCQLTHPSRSPGSPPWPSARVPSLNLRQFSSVQPGWGSSHIPKWCDQSWRIRVSNRPLQCWNLIMTKVPWNYAMKDL